MHHEAPPHEKIRFRRSDITKLDQFPSALQPAPTPSWIRVCRRGVKAALVVAVAIPVILAMAAGALFSGLGDESLRRQAQEAVSTLAGDDFDAEIGSVGISFAGFNLLGLDVSDARLTAAADGREAMQIGSARFGLRLFPLLRGEIELATAKLSDARVEPAAIRVEGGGQQLPVFDDAGLLDTDAALTQLFGGAKRLIGLFDRQDIDGIELSDITVALGSSEDELLLVRSASLEGDAHGALSLGGELTFRERVATVEGRAALDPAGETVETLSVQLDAALPDGGTVKAVLSGSDTPRGERLNINTNVSALTIPFGQDAPFVADVEVAASMERGTDKVEIDRLDIANGRSFWRFNGAFGPNPATEEPTYRFELISDGSTVAPQGSPEPALPVVARLAGLWNPDARRLSVDQVGVRSSQGEVQGRAAATFERGKSPGLELALDVHNMPVGEVKQLWPWFAAGGARNWVLSNIYGGRVETGRLDLTTPPGRIGNGVPFGAREVSGTFSIRGTRFDVAGRIPPVRDGVGAVAFRGSDVDITLESGTVFMPGGRTVDASNGVLTVREAHKPPVIGKLRIDVEGEAGSVFQLASYDPINVQRFVDLKPDDLSGSVQGTVIADIPLQRAIPVESLEWRVDLDYENLSLAKPFEGQTITAANGSIALDPTKAVIDAQARMNGSPATLALVEPLGTGSPVLRARRIALQMDDAAREAIAPGLDVLLSGLTEVELDDGSSESRAIKASLRDATLTLPWAGWSKGRGVPATVAFSLATEGNRIDLRDFNLSGETFGASGTLSFAGGEVTSVRLPNARLNRGDDFSFDMKAQGNGYAITVRGKSIDARSVVKLYAKDSTGGTAQGGAAPITLDLEADRVVGFHGETLGNVKLQYSGTGARTDLLEFSGTTASGSPVTFRDRREGEARSVVMNSADAGALLRFLDIYEHMEGGTIAMSLAGAGNGPLRGQVDARNFWIVDEPRLGSLVSTAPANDSRSLNQAVRGEIDTSRVQFERGFSMVEKGQGFLSLQQGVVRGPLIGSTFQGTLYDAAGNMDMTGTFMPAYGLNRIFGEIPLIGQILGNGRDRGLIGITFRLAGKAGEPQLQVNPLSVIAPGIFRSVFEYR